MTDEVFKFENKPQFNMNIQPQLTIDTVEILDISSSVSDNYSLLLCKSPFEIVNKFFLTRNYLIEIYYESINYPNVSQRNQLNLNSNPV